MVRMLTFSRLLILFVLVALVGLPASAAPTAPAAVSPDLGTAVNYSLIAGSTATNTGASSMPFNVGVASIFVPAGWGDAIIGPPGTLQANTPSAYTAFDDAALAYTALGDPLGADCNTTYGAIDLIGMTFLPGVYCFTSTAAVSGLFTLDAQNDPGAVWIFRMATTLTIAAGGNVQIINGGCADNVWWKAGTTVGFGALGHLKGNILAGTTFTMGDGASLDGRGFAKTTVTLTRNPITAPGCAPTAPTAAVTVEDISVAEGGDLLFTVTLDNAVQGAFTVDVTLFDVTATGGAAPLVSPEDYGNVVAQLSFAGTVSETQQFTVATLDDSVLEATETFTVSLSASSALVTDSDTAVGTITDNDTAAVTVEDVSAVEGGGLLFTVTLDNAVQGAFTVDVTLGDVTATGGAAPLVSPEDYDNVVAQLSFAGTASETQQFTVATLDDSVLEATETFGVSLSASNALVTDSDTAVGTITDNDTAGKSSIGDCVWNDANVDGFQTSGEFGINGVTVWLYKDGANSNPKDGLLQAGEKISDTVTAAGGANATGTVCATAGYYDFSVDGNETYWTEVILSNFNTGGPLDDYVFTSDNTVGSNPYKKIMPLTQLDFNDADFGYVKVDLRISITPQTDTNPVNQAHTFTVTVEQKIGSGVWMPVVGVSPAVTISPAPSSKTDNCVAPGVTDGSGECTVVINSTSATVYTANASVTASINVDIPNGIGGTIPTPVVRTRATGDAKNTAAGGTGAATKIYQAGSIGDFVWRDIDKDGSQDSGEPGVNDVTVRLFPNANCTTGTSIATTITANGGSPATDGFYEFSGLGAGTYCVEILSTEFTAGNTLENWIASPKDAAGVLDTLDSDGDPTTHRITSITIDPVASGLSKDNPTNDFGFYKNSGHTVSKAQVTDPTGTGVRVNEPISFTVTVVNTGTTWLSEVPISDTFSTSYIQFLSASILGVNTPPDATVTNAPLQTKQWNDITGVGSLAPGASIVLNVVFVGVADTTLLPAQAPCTLAQNTCNRVSTSKANGNGPTVDPLGRSRVDQKADAYLEFVTTLAAKGGFPEENKPIWALCDTNSTHSGAKSISNPILLRSRDCLVDIDGPSGPLALLETIPPENSDALVKIVNPTGVTLAGYGAAVTPSGVTLHWTTVNESEISGFDVYRIDSSRASILVGHVDAAKPGQADGASYSLTDSNAVYGVSYTYVLEAQMFSGGKGSQTIANLGYVWLPMAVR